MNLHSLLIARHGVTIAERYWPGRDRTFYSLWGSQRAFGPDDLHDMRSVSKSIVGLVYGILLERGDVPGLNTSVASLYPADSAPAARHAITVRHLLTMTTGLEWHEPSPVHQASRDDQLPLILTGALETCVLGRAIDAPPGQRFRYSGGATAVLADIMSRTTGRSLDDLARTELFEPLGITAWSWTHDFRGRPVAFAGLRLAPRDLMKIGQLVLHRGTWHERQIVPAAWIEQSTRRIVAASPTFGYGFHWWTSQLRVSGVDMAAAQAIGNGGQRLFIVPDLDLVVVITAGDYNQVEIFAAEDKLLEAIVRIAASDRQSASAAR